jgi:hypothetical protein
MREERGTGGGVDEFLKEKGTFTHFHSCTPIT